MTNKKRPHKDIMEQEQQYQEGLPATQKQKQKHHAVEKTQQSFLQQLQDDNNNHNEELEWNGEAIIKKFIEDQSVLW